MVSDPLDDLMFNDDLAAGVRALAKALKQRRPFTSEIVFITTVMDKGTKSSCHVKHPREKDRAGGACFQFSGLTENVGVLKP
jgi:hypothetical protein